MKIAGATLLLVGIFLTGCNYTKIKQPLSNNQGFNLPQEKLSELSYNLISQRVLGPRCVTCHGSSGGVSLETYSDVTRELEKIKKSVFSDRTMPKRGSLSDEELSLLWNWIKIGAPELAQNGNIGPKPEPLLATFDSINKHIFQASCVECHNPSGTGKRILLDKESLLNSPLELVLPFNADESGLVIAIERTDSKRMPPANDGYAELKEEEKLAVRKWIENGAKD